jgi:FecR protein
MSFLRVLLVAMGLFAFTAQSWAGSGWVQASSGDVSIARGQELARVATKNDVVSSDTLVSTGEKSYAILKFDDGQLVVVQANSQFKIREYRYEPKQSEQNNMVFALLKGGSRFITGLMGKLNKTSFSLNTPSATIGIRGTDFMIVMSNDAMYTQVLSGGVALTNSAGELAVSAGEFAASASMDALPSLISAAAVPAGTFADMLSIPLPSVPPVVAEPATTGGGTSSIPVAGGEASGSAGITAGASTNAAMVASSSSMMIGAGVAASTAIFVNIVTTTRH